MRIYHWLLIIILAVGIYFRFVNYPDRISMGLDSSRDAMVALYGAKNLQFPLTGPFISIAPVTTGPWYWMQLILAKLIFRTPYAPWFLLGIYSVLMILVMYSIGTLLEDKFLGLILAFITALTPNQIANAVGLSNPAVIGFYTSLVILVIIKLVKKPSEARWGFLLGIILGVTINTHYQTSGLMSLPLIFLMIQRRKFLKSFSYVLIGTGITFIPLLIFEFNNHWYNFRGLKNYFLIEQFKISSPMNWRIYLFDYWPRFISNVFGGDKLFGGVVMILVFLIFLYLLIGKKQNKIQLILLTSFVIEVVIIRYYRGERFFGYLQFFHPYLIYFLGYSLYILFKNKKTFLLGVLAAVYYIYNIIPSVYAVLTPEKLTVDTRRFMDELKSKFGKGPYKIYRCQDLLKPEVNAMVLSQYMNDMYSDQGKPLIYYWGCQYPDLIKDGKTVIAEVDKLENYDYPGVDRFRNSSMATNEEIEKAGFKIVSPMLIYQSSARWWFDEQP